MKKALLLICGMLLLLLSGCAFLASPALDERKLNTLADDGGIKTNIAAALVRESPGKATDVNVHCFRGHVFLVGEADKEFRAFAYTTARDTKGVTHVTPHWFTPGTGRSLDDTALEAKINTELLFTQKVRSTQVVVDIWGGHVVLTGVMENKAAIDRVTAVVRGVPGVKSVTSYLSVL